jgi:hypothetical protein
MPQALIDALEDDFTSDADFDQPWSLDELERSADLGSVRSAWMAGSGDGGES